MMQKSILVIEDDGPIRRGLVDALEYAGYRVAEAADGRSGLDLAVESDVELVLLDVMLPEMNGFDVLRELRVSLPTLPVIMVTARGAEDDRVRGLREGADDYVTKPFSAVELLARVEAVLRRSPERTADVRELRGPGRVVDLDRSEVRFDDGEVRHLSAREVDIIRYLAGRRGCTVDRDELLHRVWGLDPRGIETRTVDMQIVRLREKVHRKDDGVIVVRTVRGKGYRLEDGVEVVT